MCPCLGVIDTQLALLLLEGLLALLQECFTRTQGAEFLLLRDGHGIICVSLR